MPKVPKVTSLEYKIFLRQKRERGKVIFLHENKHQALQQVDAINFGGYRQSCPNYPKWHVCRAFAISQERSEG